jgi:hypothetical protein
MHRSALTARETLDNVESARLFEECGYASYEEFLERAVGPSPLLACAMAILAAEVPNETDESSQEVSEHELLVDEGTGLPAALAISDVQPLTGEADPIPPPLTPPSTGVATARSIGGGLSRRLAVLSIVAAIVCGVAGLGGAYAGVSLVAPPERVSPEAGAPGDLLTEVAPAEASTTLPPKSVPRKVTFVRNAKDIRDAIEEKF